MGAQIILKNYSINRGNFQLKNINLKIEPGEIFAVLGKTGAGKTVLLESMIGMYAGIKGVIEIDGKN